MGMTSVIHRDVQSSVVLSFGTAYSCNLLQTLLSCSLSCICLTAKTFNEDILVLLHKFFMMHAADFQLAQVI